MKITHEIMDRAILAFMKKYQNAKSLEPIPAMPSGESKNFFYYEVSFNFNGKLILLNFYLSDRTETTGMITLNEFLDDSGIIISTLVNPLAGTLKDGELNFEKDPGEYSPNFPSIIKELITAINAEKS